MSTKDKSHKSDALATALKAADGAASESTTVASPPPPPPPPHAFQFQLSLTEGRGLFPVDDRDDPDAVKKKKTTGASGTASGAGKPPGSASTAGSSTDPPKSARPGGGGSTKKKGGKEEEEIHYPFHCFLTYAPFEPILIEQPVVPPPTTTTTHTTSAAKKHLKEEEPTGPPPPQYQTSVQTPVSEDSLAPTFQFQHTQFVTNQEFFLDTIYERPLTLNVYQYFPLPADGKKRKPVNSTAGKDASSTSAPSAASAAARKKKGKKGEEEDDVKPFGELDPDSVVKLGEIQVDLKAFLHGRQTIEGWYPVNVSEETFAIASNIAATRGRSLNPDQRPEFHISVNVNKVLVDQQEEVASNLVTVTLDRIERMPNWILDCAQMEAIDAVKRQMAEAAAAAAAAQEPSRPPSGSGKRDSGGHAVGHLPLGSHAPHTPRGPSGGGARRGKDKEVNPLDEFPEKDYTDAFSLVYNMPLNPDPRLQRTIKPSPNPVPIIGWNEAQRSEVKVGSGNDWIHPRREIVVEELVSAKKKPANSSTANSDALNSPSKKKATSGRSTPNSLVVDHAPKEYQEPIVYNPNLPRAALLVNHTRTAYLTSRATAAWKESILQGQPFLIQLDHVRTPLDEKLIETGRIHQTGVILADLRPLLKPGETTMTAYFAVRQTSPPLPARAPDEGKKKRGAPGAGASSAVTSTPNKRATMTGGALAADLAAQEAAAQPILPPETFDEAHTFIKMTITLEKPLVARKKLLEVTDVLPGGALTKVVDVTPTFSSIAARSEVARPDTLLPPPRRIDARVRVSSSTKKATTPLAKELEEFKLLVKEMVLKMVEEYENASSKQGVQISVQPPSDSNGATTSSATANSLAPLTPAVTARGKHAVPTNETVNQAAPFQDLLNSSSLALHFLSHLKPRLSALIEARFHSPLPTSAQQLQRGEHSQNELYAELSREALAVLRAHVASRVKTSEQEYITRLQKDAQKYITARASYEKAGRLASFAEQHGDLELSQLYHLRRLTTLLNLYQTNHHSFPVDSALDTKDLVHSWYEYGAFLLRQQNGPEDYADISCQNWSTHGKTGSLDEGANAAIDLAEECFRQCLRYDSHFVPALLGLTLINLEQDQVEAALEFVHRVIHACPHHALLLAVQGLYHELAEEDVEGEAAYHRATEVMHHFLNQNAHANGSDILLQAILGAHGKGAISLPLFHSQTIHLLLARFLASFGFRRLTYWVLQNQIREMNYRLGLQESEQKALSEKDEKELSDSNFHIGRFDYYQFGPFLELADWYSFNPDCFDNFTSPLLRRATDLIESKHLDQHHSHTLLYAFSQQGNILKRNGRFDEAADKYMAYLAIMDEKDMNIFLDPLVLCSAASLYLLKHAVSSSLPLATLLVTHPTHTHDPYVWILYGNILSASGEYEKAEEVFSEALTKDAFNASGWIGTCANVLRRIQNEHHLRNKFTHGRAPSAPSSDEFVEAHHAFRQVLSGPVPSHDVKALVELGRLWFKFGFALETEQCYTRALLIREDEAIRTKLNWLLAAKDGAHPERETKAATAIQSVMKGAIARKQVKKKKMQQQIGAVKEQAEEKEEEVF